MPTKIMVWEIDKGKIAPRETAAFAESHREDELEEWIANTPDILGEKLLIIARQLIIPEVGRLDLLGMDANGRLIIIELKRALLPREAVAQGLDYASWINNASEEEILAYANQYLQEQTKDADYSLADAFEDKFGTKLPEWVCQNHQVLLVGAGLDASAERIVNYLAQKQIGINAIFFNYCELSDGKQILVRSVLVPDSVNPPRTGGQPNITEATLIAMANERKTVELVEVCRGLRDVWDESWTSTAGGSFRYWEAGRMVYGVNVSGQLANPPIGQLEVWVRTDKLAEVLNSSKELIERRLSQISKPFSAGRMDFCLRLTNTAEAELLIRTLRELIADSQLAKSTVASGNLHSG